MAQGTLRILFLCDCAFPRSDLVLKGDDPFTFSVVKLVSYLHFILSL